MTLAWLKKDIAPLYAAIAVNNEKCLIGLKQGINVNNWDIKKDSQRVILRSHKKFIQRAIQVNLKLSYLPKIV